MATTLPEWAVGSVDVTQADVQNGIECGAFTPLTLNAYLNMIYDCFQDVDTSLTNILTRLDTQYTDDTQIGAIHAQSVCVQTGATVSLPAGGQWSTIISVSMRRSSLTSLGGPGTYDIDGWENFDAESGNYAAENVPGGSSWTFNQNDANNKIEVSLFAIRVA